MKISDNLINEVFNKLDSLYNYKKDEQNLISSQNILIRDLKKHIIKWRKEQKI